MTSFRRTRCPHCKAKLDAGQRIHVECIDPWAEAQQAKKEREEARRVRAAAKVERAETRRRKADLKTIPELIKEAQVAFNAYIRERDKDKPCICCGKPLFGENAGTTTGGAFDAGHFRSTGSASHLRFDERNVHGQRKVCNRYGAGRAVDYRIGLVARIGLSAVEALESDNHVHRWTREELIHIRDTYRQKTRELKKEREHV